MLAAGSQTTFPDSFLVQLVHRLRDQDPSVAPALAWLDGQLARQGTTADVVVRDEHQRQVAGSITVRNIITSMRLISDVDWTELFERVSLVDDVFMAGSRFQEMDFPTRNLYRSAVEELARGLRAHGAGGGPCRSGRGCGARIRSTAEEPDNRLTDPGLLFDRGRTAWLRRRDRLSSRRRELGPDASIVRLGSAAMSAPARRRGWPAGDSAVVAASDGREPEMAAPARAPGA